MHPCMLPPFWFELLFLDFLCWHNFSTRALPLLNVIIFCWEPCPWRLCRHFKIFQIFSNQPFCCLAHKKVWILSSLYEHFVSLLFIEHCLWLSLWISFDQVVRLCGFWFIDLFFFNFNLLTDWNQYVRCRPPVVLKQRSSTFSFSYLQHLTVLMVGDVFFIL